MKRTGGEIELDFYSLLRDEIKAFISGNVYRDGARPFNSKDEDAVISFMTGTDTQRPTGFVNVNIFVADINNGDQVRLKDVSRCTMLESFMNQLIEKLSYQTGYRLSLGNTIQSFRHEDTNQHFVNCKIKYEYLTINN